MHPAPPEVDMPAEAVQPPESCDWSYNQPWQSVIGRTTSRGNLRLVVQSVVAICDYIRLLLRLRKDVVNQCLEFGCNADRLQYMDDKSCSVSMQYTRRLFIHKIDKYTKVLAHNYFVHMLMAALLCQLFLYFDVYYIFFGGVASSTGDACISCSFTSNRILPSSFLRPHALRFNVLTVACISSPPCSP